MELGRIFPLSKQRIFPSLVKDGSCCGATKGYLISQRISLEFLSTAIIPEVVRKLKRTTFPN